MYKCITVFHYQLSPTCIDLPSNIGLKWVELSLKHGCREHEPRCLRVTRGPENFRNGHDQTGNHGNHGKWRKWIF